MPNRVALSRERIVACAVEFADEKGLQALTIRSLASALDAKPMAIYYHIPNKEAIIDGMVDSVFEEITLPPPGMDWKSAIRTRCQSAREAMGRHPWAPPLMESRTTPGEATLRHHDAVLGCFRSGGLSIGLTAHAYAILDSFVYGFAFEEANLPGKTAEEFAEVAENLSAMFVPGVYPYLEELTREHVLKPGYEFGDSFEFGLDLLIDGIDRAFRVESGG